ncbi:hypothetical protein [Mycolicibacterium vaccae]|uniref:hypothetical protein n=1 Tax=Mycolicibacterium vaccae TaxID=1810 RepID=UPI003CFC7FA8
MSTDQLRDAAFRAAVWSTIEAKAKEQKDAARAELSSIPVGETIAARWGDRILAKAGMSAGRSKLVVTDLQKLLAWVKANHPTEVVETVNSAWLKTVEAKAKELGIGAVIDSQGEVIPGVEILSGAPTVSVRREKNTDDIIGELFSAGRVSLEGINTAAIEAAEVVDGEVGD